MKNHLIQLKGGLEDFFFRTAWTAASMSQSSGESGDESSLIPRPKQRGRLCYAKMKGDPTSSVRDSSTHFLPETVIPKTEQDWHFPERRVALTGDNLPSSAAVPSSNGEQRYHPTSSALVPSSNGEQRYHPTSSASSNGKQRYHPPSSEAVPSFKEERRFRPPSYQKHHQQSNEVGAQERFQEMPTLSSGERYCPPSSTSSEKRARDREDGGMLLTDDLLRQISSNSNKEPSHAHVGASHAKDVTEEDYNRGPCEGCGKLFSISELVKHEAICKHRLNRKGRITPSAVDHVPAQKSSIHGVQGPTRRKAAAGSGEVKGGTKSKADGKSGGANSRRKELSVEGLQVEGVSYNSKPVLLDLPRRAAVPNDATTDRRQQTQHNPDRMSTRAPPRSYASTQHSNRAQNVGPATSSKKASNPSLQGRNGIAKTDSASQGITGRSLENSRDGVPARDVEGTKVTAKQNGGHAPQQGGKQDL